MNRPTWSFLPIPARLGYYQITRKAVACCIDPILAHISSPTAILPTMDYDIFREELALKYPSYGYALWNPSPQGRYSAVQVGDVGFICEGYFHRLFNILLPQDHPSHREGAPPHHEPLEVDINIHTYRGTLPPNHLRSNGVSDTSDVDRRLTTGQWSSPSMGFSDNDPNSPDPAATRHSFSCSNKRGALLSLPLPAQREDTAIRKAFEKFMVEHIDEWFAFAQGLGLGIDHEWEIILVTGRHLAGSWANVAFLERDQKVSFGFRVSHGSDVEWEFTPEGAGGAALNLGPIGQMDHSLI
ncbi:hypothetical protein BC827DRAFT_80484 [Russula dissimulans]|nr:hypothetical protein BC827DRAFT_80484 [Russula dissimulans]